MFKKARFVLISVICFLISVISGYAQEESITFTTYYPSPYGVYREMRSQRMAIGDTYIRHSDVCWEGDTGCTGFPPQVMIPSTNDVDLIVQGNVGIGTTAPVSKLHTEGAITIHGSHPDWNTLPTATVVGLAIDTVPTGARYKVSSGTHEFEDNVIIQGNVGIGTIDPSNARLRVEAGLNNHGIVSKAGGPVYWGGVFSNSTGSNEVDISGPYGLIVKSGNVGIGTTGPGTKLAVAGEINAGSGADKTVFHKGNLIHITCAYQWIPHGGNWQEYIWTNGDCGLPAKLPSGYANCMRAVSGSDWAYSGGRLMYCDTDKLRIYQAVGAGNAYGRCDYLCWD